MMIWEGYRHKLLQKYNCVESSQYMYMYLLFNTCTFYKTVHCLLRVVGVLWVVPLMLQTPLYIATKNGHTAVVKILVNTGADVNKVSPWCVHLMFHLCT